MRFRNLHTTIFRSSRNRAITNAPPPRNPRRRFTPPAAETPPTMPSSNVFTDSDVVKCNIAIRNHLHNGQFDDGLCLFNSMPRRSTISYSTIISGCFSNGKFKLAQQLFDEMPVKHLITCNIMIRGYIKNKDLGAARRLFDEMPEKNVVSWSTILYGYVQSGLLDEAKRVFDEMPEKNVVSWTTILVGYAQNGFLDEAKRVFDEMPVKNVVSWNAMITGYAQNNVIAEARDLFDRMPFRDCSSWAAIIAGYSQNGDNEEALRIFVKAARDRGRLNRAAFASALSSCADISATELGKQIHGRVAKGGVELDCYVGNALVSMYCRCGNINEAHEVFEKIEDKDVISWNAIIVGYAKHGFGQEALRHFESMKQLSIQPDQVTMVKFQIC